ncbi:MAG: phosphotransferase enzyme family protein [Chloroflexota bacterium]
MDTIAAQHADVMRAFGIDLDGVESLYAHSPVYRVRWQDQDAVLKRSRPALPDAEAIARWLTHLAGRDVRVVTPLDGPRSLTEPDGTSTCWVFYPFVDGIPYQRTLAQISAAGDLLGRIHATGKKIDHGLPLRPRLDPLDADEVAAAFDALVAALSRYAPDLIDEALRRQEVGAAYYLKQAAPNLRVMDLPLANATWDYKIANLIYVTEDSPVLVDADSGARLPRVLDLAIAALLLHNDAADSALSRQEWLAFFAAYSQHVTLKPEERAVWPDVLLAAWMDEALWLLAADSGGWRQPRQSSYLRDLLRLDLGRYALPPDETGTGKAKKKKKKA